ncbi:MAG TPA: FHA domain-containing protein [Stenomitos sp.]
MIVCASCNHENEAGVQFCDECGSKLAVTATIPVAAPVTAGTAGGPSPIVSEPASYAAKIVITRGGTVGKEFALEGSSETHIGRWDPDGGAFPEVDLTSDDDEAKISRKHARVFIEGGEYYLEDLGSLNGTYVNRGPRLLPGSPQILKDGDEIVMGKTFFKFLKA